MTSSFRKNWKSLFGRILFATRINKLLMRNKAVIVAFHNVGDLGSPEGISVSESVFADFCALFSKYFSVISLDDLVQRLITKSDISNCLVITFDDGYQDNYDVAKPILEKYELPATFFVATSFIGSSVTPWWDAEYGLESKWMSWDQVIDLDRSSFTVCPHTCTHVDLAAVPDDVAKKEVVKSKKELESRLGHEVRHFAYPYGRAEQITESIRSYVKDCGFESCLSCFGGVVSPDSEVLNLPRTPINDWYQSPYQFGFETAFEMTE